MSDLRSMDVLTAVDVATILQLNKNTVYNLAKTGALPSYSVGRKLRFRLSDVDAYIEASRRVSPTPGAETPAPTTLDASATSALAQDVTVPDDAFVMCGHDMLLDILANYVSAGGVAAMRRYQSGYEGLVDIYLGRAHAVAIHLWDSSTNTYNLPYVKRLVPGRPVVVVELARRTQGLIVRESNPLGLNSWSDLLTPSVVLANRQSGTGSRVLLDERLRLLEADPYSISGYDREIVSELAMGTLIARGDADVGIGTERVFRQVSGLDYRPLQTETLALVMAKSATTARIVRTIRALLVTEMFQRELVGLTGYDFAHMGDRLYES